MESVTINFEKLFWLKVCSFLSYISLIIVVGVSVLLNSLVLLFILAPFIWVSFHHIHKEKKRIIADKAQASTILNEKELTDEDFEPEYKYPSDFVSTNYWPEDAPYPFERVAKRKAQRLQEITIPSRRVAQRKAQRR